MTPTHPLVDYQLDFSGQLRGELAKRLIEYAEFYTKEPVELLADIIEFVLKFDLVDTVVMQKKKIKLDFNTPSYLEERFKNA